ncbi:hypothetical protein EL26_14100 [Tumebacillus flagellatus]|uniref:Prepilin-type N-terminal cleavage/methylation domain-containing protein n=2 Tax=Tumebacillus flagellatus TaxID=1157490 RepID=A0A074LNN1_9BACL|nr:hypothetical protein EL26_14100 [Tumebacillus flagellatus]
MLRDDERGVTLMELLMVIALMGVVFGGVVAFSISTMSSFRDTTQGSLNQEQASQIMNQLAQDLRRSASTDRWQAAADHKFHLHTARSNDETQEGIDVAYEQAGTEILYTTSRNGTETTLSLTKHGTFQVEQEGDSFTIAVTVGDVNDANRAEMTTKVSRFNWGR